MKIVTAALLALTFSLLLLANANAQDAKPSPITNGSFESPVVPEGAASGDVPSWGWTGWSGNCLCATVHPGSLGTPEPWPSTPPFGISGHNFCKLFATADGGTGVFWQDTGMKYQAGATYTLTAAFGLQAGIGAQAGQKLAPNCVMFLGNSSFAQFGAITIAAANLTSGEFKDQSVTYTATGSEARGDGTYGAAGDIIVGFWLAPNSPAQSYLDFDNVRLKAPPPPPPTPVPNYFGTHM